MKASIALKPFLILLIALPAAQVACCASGLSSGCGNPQPLPLTQTPVVNSPQPLPLTQTPVVNNGGLN